MEQQIKEAIGLGSPQLQPETKTGANTTNNDLRFCEGAG